MTGMKKVLADAIARFSGTHTRYFDTKAQAELVHGGVAPGGLAETAPTG